MVRDRAALLQRPATELARLVSEREISAVELLELHITRVEERNPQLNAIVEVRLEQARDEAAAADSALRDGRPAGPLHGVPFTAKDAIAVAGMRWTNGSRLSADAVAAHDAPAVRRLRAAGAILLGKTNVPEFCAFYDTDNDLFGPTRNPHAPERSAGGSSGGEAAAVASGMSALGLGSDLGSSVRNPAHFTGLFALKPSRALSPCTGHAPDLESPLWWRFAVIGLLARGAGDLAHGLEAVAAGTPTPPRPGAGVVAVYEDDLLQPVAADCRRAVRRAADALAEAGFDVVEDRPPREEEIRREYDFIIGAELGPWLAGFTAGREAALSRYGRMAVDALSGGSPDLPAYLEAWTRLARLEREVDEWFERRRLALCPVAPGPAPPLGGGFTEIDGEPVRPGGKLSLCTLANAVGLPAAAVPVLRDAAGLPVGVQLIGGRGRDLEVVAAARVLEQALGGFIAPRSTDAARAATAPRAH